MDCQKTKLFWLAALIVFVISFGLIWLGVRMVLQQSLDFQSLFAYVLMALTFGGLAGAFYALNLKAALTLFGTGLIIGFFAMYWHFIAGMDGWGDLSGIFSLFIYSGIGLAAGLLTQLVWHIIKRGRKG